MRKYELYYLYDPRNQTVCYVGITCASFKKRLNQHRRPKLSNKSPIANLQRLLIKDGKTLLGEVIHTTYSRYYIEFYEKCAIRRLKNRYKSQIKNIQRGGYNSFGMSVETKEKMLKTRTDNGVVYKNGSDCYNTNLEESDVKEIYNLFNQFYSNTEIVESFNKKLGRTQVSMLRNGSNWGHLFREYNMVTIPSIPNNGGYSGRDKVEIIALLDKGTSILDVKKSYPKLPISDLKRIKERRIWDKGWYVYDNFYKK